MRQEKVTESHSCHAVIGMRCGWFIAIQGRDAPPRNNARWRLAPRHRGSRRPAFAAPPRWPGNTACRSCAASVTMTIPSFGE